ncbi:zf-CCHC domain-containing protein [Tanacetum coccineum]|uniref:Zf-CCHC domain-containing protein n=1 Tax=Tanacetum coccineum TaxID=301880 RepID=A0ABQ5DXY6_9ASTR
MASHSKLCFYYEVEDSETKLMKETPYELLEDDQKKKIGKKNEAKMTLYNALSLKNCKIDLLTQEYEKFSISNEETIDSGFTRFNTIMTSLKSLDPGYLSKNHVRKFLRALPLKWRAKVTAIEEAKDLATLPLDELIGNLKVYEIDLDNNGVGSKTTKEKVKSLALKVKVTREQTSDDSNSHGGSDEENSFGNKYGEGSKPKGVCYNYEIEGHFASECRNPKESNAFVEGAWSDSEDGDEAQKDSTCLMAIDSQKVCLKCDLLLDDWIVDSGCTKHMTGIKRLFTLYKAYNGGHVVFGSNLKGKVVGGGSQGNANDRTRNEVSTSRVLEFLHLDLFGPSSIQSYRGNFYTLLIVDDHSNYT